MREAAISPIELCAFFTGISKLSLPNHNGTDFTPAFIDDLLSRGKSVHITLLSAYDPSIEKPRESIETEVEALKNRFPGVHSVSGHNTLFSQRSLNDFSEIWNQPDTAHKPDEYHIILLATGSPHQELWCDHMRKSIDRHHVLCFCAGGLIDFISGREKRAPTWMRSLKLEWLYRSITLPKKNRKKMQKSQSIFKLIFASISPFSPYS